MKRARSPRRPKPRPARSAPASLHSSRPLRASHARASYGWRDVLFRFARIPVAVQFGMAVLGTIVFFGLGTSLAATALAFALSFVFGVASLALELYLGYWLVRTFGLRIRHAAVIGAEAVLVAFLWSLAVQWFVPDVYFASAYAGAGLSAGAIRAFSLVVTLIVLLPSLAFSALVYALGAWWAKRSAAGRA